MKQDIHEIQWFDCKVDSIVTESNSGKKSTQYIISGPFMRADIPTRNNRVYKKEVANKAIAELRPMVQDKRIRMLVDHPDWMSSGASLSRSGALLLDITDIQEDGFAYYKAKILNTRVGKDLKAILDEGSKVGVSTRGIGIPKEEEIPGYSGKFDVIYEWELSSIDFVDDPAVIDTEAYMHIESKKRSSGMFKTVEELKTAYPVLCQSIVDSTTVAVKKEFEEKLQASESKQNEAAQLITAKEAELEAFVETFKKIFPDKFTIVEESTIVTEKENALKEVTKTLENATVEVDTLRKQIKDIEDKHIQSEKDTYIEHLQTSDPDFFKFESFQNCFENCMTKEEVKTVYETNSKIVKEMKEKVGAPAPAKTVQTDEVSEKEETGLKDELLVEFNARNLQRRRSGLEPWTEEQFMSWKKPESK